MRLKKHARNPLRPGRRTYLQVTHGTNPTIVWITRELQLFINKGDTIKDVAPLVVKHCGIALTEARQLVAYWFALSERAHFKKFNAKWRGRELDASPVRRYLIKSVWQ